MLCPGLPKEAAARTKRIKAVLIKRIINRQKRLLEGGHPLGKQTLCPKRGRSCLIVKFFTSIILKEVTNILRMDEMNL